MSATVLEAPAIALPRRELPRAVRRKRFLIAVADHSILIALAIMFLAPFVFILLTSVMSNEQALSANLWPQPFHWHNFVDVFTKAPLLRYYEHEDRFPQAPDFHTTRNVRSHTDAWQLKPRWSRLTGIAGALDQLETPPICLRSRDHQRHRILKC